jgi:hypothetical protein
MNLIKSLRRPFPCLSHRDNITCSAQVARSFDQRDRVIIQRATSFWSLAFSGVGATDRQVKRRGCLGNEMAALQSLGVAP